MHNLVRVLELCVKGYAMQKPLAKKNFNVSFDILKGARIFKKDCPTLPSSRKISQQIVLGIGTNNCVSGKVLVVADLVLSTNIGNHSTLN